MRESETRYRSLFDNMAEGFALHEIITDADGNPSDYRFLEVNPAFENLTGLRREAAVGKTRGNSFRTSKNSGLKPTGVWHSRELQRMSRIMRPRWIAGTKPLPTALLRGNSPLCLRMSLSGSALRRRSAPAGIVWNCWPTVAEGCCALKTRK